MPPPDEPLVDDTILDISHESLMRIWDRLEKWVEEEAESAQAYRRLAQAASLHAQGKAALWSDPDLSLATGWLAKARPNAAWAMRYDPAYMTAIAFLDASVSREAAHERAAIKAARREVRRLRAFSLTISALFVAASLGGFLAYKFEKTVDADRQIVVLEGHIPGLKAPVLVGLEDRLGHAAKGTFRLTLRGTEPSVYFVIEAKNYLPRTLHA